MSQIIIELPTEDAIPLETNWHRIAINLLLESVRQNWRAQTNYFAGGNMFVYYSMQQVRTRDYKGRPRRRLIFCARS